MMSLSIKINPQNNIALSNGRTKRNNVILFLFLLSSLPKSKSEINTSG